ncbi:hypothetical protein OOU_Y34scaffold00924g1 [Pyricularia oryzae Y34]|nr:hypothetical protein OOU_Y34scaffold00924g1 [Pyricularia oryzae Y34]
MCRAPSCPIACNGSQNQKRCVDSRQHATTRPYIRTCRPTLHQPNPTVGPVPGTLTMQMQDEDPHQAQSMSMGGMTMVFFSSQSTPLFSRAWTPSSPEAYAGTCIFIFLLTITQYLLIAARNVVFEEFDDQMTATSWKTLQEHKTQAAAPTKDDEENRCLSRHETVTSCFLSVSTAVMEQQRRRSRTSIVTARAATEVVISATGYLVMLAAMTMNVGYFLSVIAADPAWRQRRRRLKSGADR